MMADADDAWRIVSEAGEDVPVANAIRSTAMHGGVLCIELFRGDVDKDNLKGIAVALIDMEHLESVAKQFNDALANCRAISEPGLASMEPEGRA